MRVIIVGAGSLGKHLTKNMIDQGNEVVLIEKNPAIAKELAESLDCTVIQAEGTRPDILEKAEIDKADAIVACTSSDQNNIMIGLIAKEENVDKIIVKTDEKQFMEVAKKLGFNHIINPSNISSMIVSDLLRGVNTVELSNLVRSDVRFISVIIGEKATGLKTSEVSLPKKSSVIGLYRKKDFILAGENPTLEKDDELIIVTRMEYVNDLHEQLK
ncbi:trk system potassium uptake protein TrkA [Methanohalophilus levihalophilus]|uniref:potassium channel family protein n=1 Tax=Methanohalophilus levihalophilus TaxID=1431282 RepID=UPI001AE16277|nr:TrkA family potassium uptake protein [Methanohalophilus levihalophilus]MBP2029527.1 trk system potassium uptake protein TrkA [Methanohalophilus levihalophilus]